MLTLRCLLGFLTPPATYQYRLCTQTHRKPIWSASGGCPPVWRRRGSRLTLQTVSLRGRPWPTLAERLSKAKCVQSVPQLRLMSSIQLQQQSSWCGFLALSAIIGVSVGTYQPLWNRSPIYSREKQNSFGRHYVQKHSNGSKCSSALLLFWLLRSSTGPLNSLWNCWVCP